MISVIILTKNEEHDLPACLQSVQWSNDVHLLDSGSTDATLAIATQYKVTIAQHPFESFGKQRNHALTNLPIVNDWVLFLDADEVVSAEFKAAIEKAIITVGPEVAGFYCCWKMILEGTWLKRCDNFPKWQFRLLRKEKARFVDYGHGQKEGKVQGTIGYIKEPYLHYGFSKGWSHWIDRHNRYSTLEATARLLLVQPFKNIFSTHGSVRNPALKFWVSRMPGWPILRFVYTYFLRLGFLEGKPGLIYCINMAYYEFLIQLKMRELKRTNQAALGKY